MFAGHCEVSAHMVYSHSQDGRRHGAAPDGRGYGLDFREKNHLTGTGKVVTIELIGKKLFWSPMRL